MGIDDNSGNEPQTQLETDRSSGSGRFPPSKTAVGTGDSGQPQYKEGEHLRIEITGTRPGGYEILILEHRIRGFSEKQ